MLVVSPHTALQESIHSKFVIRLILFSSYGLTSVCSSNSSNPIGHFLAGRFPMYVAFPLSEYYQPVRLPYSHLAVLSFYSLFHHTLAGEIGISQVYVSSISRRTTVSDPGRERITCQCVIPLAAFHYMKSVGLYNVEYYGALYPFTCVAVCPVPHPSFTSFVTS